MFKSGFNNIPVSRIGVTFPIHFTTWTLERAQLQQACLCLDFKVVKIGEGFGHLGLERSEANLLITSKLFDLSQDRIGTLTQLFANFQPVQLWGTMLA